MSDVFCKCGYEGNQVIQFETVVPEKRLVETHYYGLFDYVKTVSAGSTTLNWACPKCGRLLVQQRGGLSYNHKELEVMFKRLRQNSRENERWFKQQSIKNAIEINRINKQIEKHQAVIAQFKSQLKDGESNGNK